MRKIFDRVSRNEVFRTLILNIVVSFLYVFSAKLGLYLSTVHGNISLIWPPTGLSLSVVYFFGPKVIPAIWAGAFFANFFTSAPLSFILSASVGNTLEAVAGVYLLRRVNFNPKIEKVKDVLNLTLFSALLSTIISASVGVSSLFLNDILPREKIFDAWITWWAGDALSDIVIAPVIFSWLEQKELNISRKHFFEGIIFGVLIIISGMAVYGGFFPHNLTSQFSYSIFPIIIWAGLRFSPKGATLAIFIAIVIAVLGTAYGNGPFVQNQYSKEVSLLFLYGFMSTVSITALVFSVTINQRKKAEIELVNSLKEKEILIKELYHRTKNNMQVISSFLVLQGFYTSDEKIHQFINDSEARIKTMSLVHESLFSSGSLSRISIQSYISDLTDHVYKNYKSNPKISIKKEIEEIAILIDTAIPCGLLLNELLSNSFKYAFNLKKYGTIRIILKRINKDEVELIYSDDGDGFPAGFDFKGNGSFGIDTIISIAEHQLQGNIDFTSIPGNGMECRVTFKDNIYSERI